MTSCSIHAIAASNAGASLRRPVAAIRWVTFSSRRYEGRGWGPPHVNVGCWRGGPAGRATDVGAPVVFQRTSVGLDVHARSVAAAAIDGQTGEITRRKITPDHGEILAWILSLAGPARVVYEAGPTGFGLARFLLAAGIECLVAAPSKLQRPAGDRVKTDARDALHLARLLHLGEVTSVTIPSVEQEAARDLVRPVKTSAVI
nr:transposase [Jatrophihabitans sp. DSM 44399]